MNDSIIETHDLKKYFEEGRVKALDGVDISIRRGEYISIIGPSGCGKSTLLNMISALDRPTSGQVFLDGADLATFAALDEVRSHKVGFIFQLHNLLPQLTALENVIIPMHEISGSASAKEAKARLLLELIGVGHLAGKRPTRMSGGERQRVAIARALANDPLVILGDEPTGDVDTKAGLQIMDILEKLNREKGVTLIVVTHALDIAKHAQRTIEMRDGRIVHQ
ncbi:MAG: ABC transporter ATP-binding protein [Patescibacteria group bacterium]|nr:ABC transporter ATP-binding protein [Patescibacteria group bacterium]MDD5715760.1 ABC transporter ATP-binding protein [Patescibacteria group bacterium]